MSEFFTKKEMTNVEKALDELATVGIQVEEYSDTDRQRRVFFDKARLWHVIKNIVQVLYLEKLIQGEHFFVDEDGNKYVLIEAKEAEE